MAGPVSHPHGTCNMASCLELFRLGWDTQKIAEYWQIPEDEAHRRVTAERSAEKRLPCISETSPYAPGERYAGKSIAAWLARSASWVRT